MRSPVLKIEKLLDALWVRPGEALTVYLATDNALGNFHQVELRVTPAGVPEIYCDDVAASTFDRWVAEPDSASQIEQDRRQLAVETVGE